MRTQSLIARSLSVVDRTLRSKFPRDFDQRCLYAAFGLRSLLRDVEVNASIVGGDFAAFVVSRDERKSRMQGFGFGGEGPSHYWVATDEMLIDIGPHYLPSASRYPAAKLPIVAWRTGEPLPLCLRYKARIRYDPDVRLQSDPEIMARMEDFLAECTRRMKAEKGQPKLPSWLLTDSSSIMHAARGGDVWARNALRFISEVCEDDLPF